MLCFAVKSDVSQIILNPFVGSLSTKLSVLISRLKLRQHFFEFRSVYLKFFFVLPPLKAVKFGSSKLCLFNASTTTV